jgi:DNA end-binding protein Ku
MMPATKSAISFGLVHIPVSLNPVITNNDTRFNLLHKKCENRIKYQKYCPHCHKEVNTTEIVKGYEFGNSEYVTLENEDFENIKSKNDKLIEIISFVDLKEIDPIYFERSYYLQADAKNKAFGLFKTALKKQNKIAIAKTVLGNKSYYVILRSANNNIVMSTLYYEEEIKQGETHYNPEFSKQEMALALQLIDSMSGKFEPDKYHDEYQNKLKQAIEDKIDGKKIKPVKERETKTINDLMTALQESLKNKRTA